MNSNKTKTVKMSVKEYEAFCLLLKNSKCRHSELQAKYTVSLDIDLVCTITITLDLTGRSTVSAKVSGRDNRLYGPLVAQGSKDYFVPIYENGKFKEGYTIKFRMDESMKLTAGKYASVYKGIEHRTTYGHIVQMMMREE